ncbi:MAG: aminotransferase class V-fold PLP-dependent enzyme, partial [bacterium]|nr:aminotransferase class V-fold PLP-dependent enzyme [bacterium]
MKLDLSELPRLLNARTRILSLTHVSNVLGTINPVAEIAAAAHRREAIVILDAAQSVGHLPLDLDALGVDLAAFSTHKCYGPMGLGILAGNPETLMRLEPLEGGGEMIEEVYLDRATWAPLPQSLEAGTANIGAAAAFPAAIDMLDEIGLEQVRKHECSLLRLAVDRLRRIGGVHILGPWDVE